MTGVKEGPVRVVEGRLPDPHGEQLKSASATKSSYQIGLGDFNSGLDIFNRFGRLFLSIAWNRPAQNSFEPNRHDVFLSLF